MFTLPHQGSLIYKYKNTIAYVCHKEIKLICP